VKFLVDMPLSLELAQWLRTEGHTAVHANELSMNRSQDAEIFQAAARDGCVVITADLDFPRLLAKLGSTSGDRPSPFSFMCPAGNSSRSSSSSGTSLFRQLNDALGASRRSAMP
jgi:hypothetical protein